MNKILYTGASGQLGSELRRLQWPASWEAVGVDIEQLDLTDLEAIAKLVNAEPWKAVINCAAYTAVDKAESDILTAWKVNALAPAAFGASCALRDIPLIQISTDYVFDGEKIGAWDIDDPTAPINVYGASKLSGELAVRTSGARYAILRTAWVVSAHGANFVKTMLRLASLHQSVRVVADQRGSPTAASDLAAAAAQLTIRLADDAEAPGGTWHFSNAGPTTWAAFAKEIFAQSAARGGPSAAVIPIVTSDYPTPARRPANSLLQHRAIERDYGIVPRPWQDALSEIMDELIGARL